MVGQENKQTKFTREVYVPYDFSFSFKYLKLTLYGYVSSLLPQFLHSNDETIHWFLNQIFSALLHVHVKRAFIKLKLIENVYFLDMGIARWNHCCCRRKDKSCQA